MKEQRTKGISNQTRNLVELPGQGNLASQSRTSKWGSLMGQFDPPYIGRGLSQCLYRF